MCTVWTTDWENIGSRQTAHGTRQYEVCKRDQSSQLMCLWTVWCVSVCAHSAHASKVEHGRKESSPKLRQFKVNIVHIYIGIWYYTQKRANFFAPRDRFAPPFPFFSFLLFPVQFTPFDFTFYAHAMIGWIAVRVTVVQPHICASAFDATIRKRELLKRVARYTVRGT